MGCCYFSFSIRPYIFCGAESRLPRKTPRARTHTHHRQITFQQRGESVLFLSLLNELGCIKSKRVGIGGAQAHSIEGALSARADDDDERHYSSRQPDTLYFRIRDMRQGRRGSAARRCVFHALCASLFGRMFERTHR
jgi:hypothetical protein